MSIFDEVKFFKIAVLDNIIEAQIVDSILVGEKSWHHKNLKKKFLKSYKI